MKIPHSSAGVTYLEILLASFIFGIVVVIAGLYWHHLLQSSSFSVEEYRSIDYAFNTVDMIGRELREARGGEDGAHPLALANDNEIMFYSDIDGDFMTDRIRYWVQDGSLKKGILKPSGDPPGYSGIEQVKTVVDFVDDSTQPIFSYYNGDWPGDVVNNPLVPSERALRTRLVRLTLTIHLSDNIGADKFSLQSGIQLRNLKDNL